MKRAREKIQPFKYVGPGRPSKITPEVVKKMEEAAAIGASVAELCYYAGITKPTYYKWLEENPELSDRLEELREKPFLKARQTIVGSLGQVNNAFRFMEKKRPEEFAEGMKITHGGSISNTDMPEEDRAAIASFHAKLKENMLRRSMDKAKKDGELA